MSTDDAAGIADALGVLLQRRFRSALYGPLTEGVHEDVDPAAYPILSGIARIGPISAAALGYEIGLDRSIVSRRAARLIAAGLLRSTADSSDARAVLLSLTGPGNRVVKILRGRLVAAVSEHLAGWTEADQHRLAVLLERFVEPGSLEEYHHTTRTLGVTGN